MHLEFGQNGVGGSDSNGTGILLDEEIGDNTFIRDELCKVEPKDVQH